jgi:hypothetical protein
LDGRSAQGRYLHTGQHNHRISAHRYPYLELGFEWAKTVHALDRAVTVIGPFIIYLSTHPPTYLPTYPVPLANIHNIFRTYIKIHNFVEHILASVCANTNTNTNIKILLQVTCQCDSNVDVEYNTRIYSYYVSLLSATVDRRVYKL